MKIKFDFVSFGSAIFAILLLVSILMSVLKLTIIPGMHSIWIFMPFIIPIVFIIFMALLLVLFCLIFGIRQYRHDN